MGDIEKEIRTLVEEVESTLKPERDYSQKGLFDISSSKIITVRYADSV
jgi:hypothetical protein